jgi:uncharacterized membrane-anchored protein
MTKVRELFTLSVCACAFFAASPITLAQQPNQQADVTSDVPQAGPAQPGQGEPADAASDAETEHARAVLQSLHWLHGPQEVPIDTETRFAVPQGFVFLGKEDTNKFMEVTHNPASGQAYMFAPEDLSWFALVSYEDTGHVPDTETIDADAILQNIKAATDAGNQERAKRGWDTLTIQGWQEQPHYDSETKRLEWATVAVDSQQTPIVNFNTRILGRTGLVAAELVTDPTSLNTSVLGFKTALRGVDFVQGQTYSEFKPGDHVAEYGLGALIVGGTAAAVVKSGAGKWLIKGLVAAGIAVLAGIKGLFGRKTKA